jgi:putative transposase
MCVDWDVSIRRASGAVCFDTSTFHYTSRRADQATVERRIKEIAETRVGYGYRRVHVLLKREGWMINPKKIRRIYNELGLQLRNTHPKRRVTVKLRKGRQEASGPNEVWVMDFVHDQLALGKWLRILTIVDTHPRLCPAADPKFSNRGEDIVQRLERVCGRIGCPKTIRVDNGSEFISRDLDLWAYANDFAAAAKVRSGKAAPQRLTTLELTDLADREGNASSESRLCKARFCALLPFGTSVARVRCPPFLLLQAPRPHCTPMSKKGWLRFL